MNILMICKYPPIAGGESAKAYWLIQGLAKKGHKIYIVSNCQEVEDNYRQNFEIDDLDKLNSENIKLFSTSPTNPLQFIPRYNPFSEKLTSLALEVTERYDIDIILGWYLLPYCVSAYNVSKITGKKVILQHAGSDVSRLLLHRDLNYYLEYIIKQADGLLVYPSSIDFFHNFQNNKIYQHNSKYHDSFNTIPTENILHSLGIKKNADSTFLFLGKISKHKGIQYLIDAFQSIQNNANLLIVGDGPYKINLRKEIHEKSISNIFFQPHFPPWKIPLVIKSVKSVVIPEYNFNVKLHRTRLPIESLLCGKTPIVSSEIFYNYPEEIRKYFIKIESNDLDEFSEIMFNVANDKNKNDLIKKDEIIIKKYIGSFDNYIEEMELVLETVLN